MDQNRLIAPFSKTSEAKPHTAVYTMHKYFARRPWNVFNELVSHYSAPNEIILDPFCGGGVTVVESLKLGRKAIGVDVNPLATYVTRMQTKPLSLEAFQQAFHELGKEVEREIESLYSTICDECAGVAIADWIEWNEQTKQIIRLKYDCPTCKTSLERAANRFDSQLAQNIERDFAHTIKQERLWFPRTRIPVGDKTNSLLNQEISYFHQLFTRRNLLALCILLKQIQKTRDKEAREFLRFAFSSSLKWASRQSHLRGQIVEGWAMHAYWIYPKSLEINVWNTFKRRTTAVLRGKKYSNEQIGDFYRRARNFDDLAGDRGSCLILNRSATRLPIPNENVDAIITDPPYGANVNYGELSDFWFIWLSDGEIVRKRDEVIINRTQRKALLDYERLLHNVLKECYRVLRPNCNLVSTFNSKDMRVVASFITAASRAGFILDTNGFVYQKPIRSYVTTFHAMQIGAFVGDFIFTFIKAPKSSSEARTTEPNLREIKDELTGLVHRAEKRDMTEPLLRENAYRILIPFLAGHSQTDLTSCREAVNFFETKMSERKLHFSDLRKRITESRRRTYRSERRSRKKAR